MHLMLSTKFGTSRWLILLLLEPRKIWKSEWRSMKKIMPFRWLTQASGWLDQNLSKTWVPLLSQEPPTSWKNWQVEILTLLVSSVLVFTQLSLQEPRLWSDQRAMETSSTGGLQRLLPPSQLRRMRDRHWGEELKLKFTWKKMPKSS